MEKLCINDDSSITNETYSPPMDKKSKPREFLNSSWGDVNRGSPRSQRRSWRERKLSPEGNFFEMLRDSDSASVRSNHARGSSFRRRRSLDSRPRSKEIPRDFATANGGVFNKHESLKNTYSDVKDTEGQLPSIIVDESRHNDDNVAEETDRLLGSRRSVKDTAPECVILEVETDPSEDEGPWKAHEKVRVCSSNPQLYPTLHDISESIL